MSMHNASRYIRACIDSILNQSFGDFELIIVDDGSTDDSVSIVKSYADPRIKLILNTHDYIDSLNKCVIAAEGKYIARMDADDIMAENRLQTQYSYMEQHMDIDIMFGRIELISAKGDLLGLTYCITKGYITLCEMAEGCCLAHPTAFIRASSIAARKHMLYHPDYAFAEDYKLWVELLIDGLCFYNSEQIFGYYRRHEHQISEIKNDEQRHKGSIIREQAIRYHSFLTHNEFNKRKEIPVSRNKLTIVIPFLNEKEEVRNTVESIRTTVGTSVDIIVINDNSDKDYDYATALSDLNVNYITNDYRIGAAMSKEKGVSLVQTPFFLILDAHMRFYSSDWAQKIITELTVNPNRLLCCQTRALEKDTNGVVKASPFVKTAHGAYMSFKTDSYVPGITWNNRISTSNAGSTMAIPCVLGAGYASSKAYWNKIAGMRGLQHYGCEEVFISIKAWKEGGGCYLLPDLTIGHIYRKAFPYSVQLSQHIYNYLLIADTLFPTSDRCFAHAVAWKLNKQAYFNTFERIVLFKDEIAGLRTYFSAWNAMSYEAIKLLNSSCAKDDVTNQTTGSDDVTSVISEILNPSSAKQIIGIAPKMAALVCLLAHMKSNNTLLNVETRATELWDQITDELPKCSDIFFSTGLTGFGWLLILAAEHGLVEDDIASELSQVDRQISVCSPSRITELSLSSGLGGIYAYVVARFGYNKRHNLNDCFNTEFIDELTKTIPIVINQTADWRTFNFALQLSKRGSSDWTILCPNLNEVIDISKAIPSNPKYRDYSLNGVLGTTINFYIS